MELISQHTKKIMEGCKKRARDEGLSFMDESLEYIVTNRDLIELSPKVMIPTLYDYWVHDVKVLSEKGQYELYPSNPYETVINTKPAISFYNDNNPAWLNVMIFYHVLAHIDFFQNNHFFKHTWEDDFTGQALSDKRLIASLRSRYGRWVDYIIEFTRGIDNLVGYFDCLSEMNFSKKLNSSDMVNYYFDVFLQKISKVPVTIYMKEIETYNKFCREDPKNGEANFFLDLKKKVPEFDALFEKHQKSDVDHKQDVVLYIMENSPFLNMEKNKWMKEVISVVRKTSLYFQPQIRTKILNEGWASYWHETLFMKDDRIKGHEVDFARVNANVTSMPRVGLNPYALGMNLFYYIEEKAEKGKFTYDFTKIKNSEARKKYNKKTGKGREFIFDVRENYSDTMFISSFLDQEFVTEKKLFVAGKRKDRRRKVWQYYVKSRDGAEYKKMVQNSLYHPPSVVVDTSKTDTDVLYLNHLFEEKPLVSEYIPNTLLGIEYLWGGKVKLETTELTPKRKVQKQGYMFGPPVTEDVKPESKWRRILYTMENKKIKKEILKG